MEYRIVLQRMEFRALHGCYELERKVGNRFTVDLELTAELGDAAVQDDVRKTVNYLTVYEVVRMQMRITQSGKPDFPAENEEINVCVLVHLVVEF